MHAGPWTTFHPSRARIISDDDDRANDRLQVVIQAWGLVDPVPIESARNRHYFVSRNGESLVLRRYRDDHFDDLGFEHDVMATLGSAGWPVPRVLDFNHFGGADWLLMTRCIGASRARTHSEQIERGRLLARFHQALGDFKRERVGFPRLEALVRNDELAHELRALDPQLGSLLSSYLDATRSMFDQLETHEAERSILHGDFVPWNLLYDGETLTGVIDFEACHRGLAVTDFAGAWRGRYDDVITGYESERVLEPAERALIVPCYWAWLFLGIDHDLRTDPVRGASASTPKLAPAFDWQLGQFARRDSKYFDPWRSVLPRPPGATRG